MTVKIPYNFGDSVYIKADPEQKEFIFVGFKGRPGAIIYILDYIGDELEVYDFQTTTEKDLAKFLDFPEKHEKDE